MGLLARSLLARDAIAALIILGTLTMLIGELYTLHRWLSRRAWLPRISRVAICSLFLILGAASVSFLFSPWLIPFTELFEEYGLIQVTLLITLGAAYFIVLLFLCALMGRWWGTLSHQRATNPFRRWLAKHLPQTAFPRVGASLLALGIVMLGLACWVVF